jgi:hypothetical protein
MESGIEGRIMHRIDPHSLFENGAFGASNAATSYVEIVRSMESRKESERQDPAPLHSPTLTDEEFELFLHGVQQAECDFSRESLVIDNKPVRLAPTVDFSDNLGHLQPLRAISMAVVTRGEQYETYGNWEIAVRCYEGVVKFGFDVERGRESVLQVFVGAAIQRNGAQKLKELYDTIGDMERVREWSDFLRDTDDIIERFKHKTTHLTTASGTMPEAIADRLWILEHDKDHLFRREALVGLGAMRTFAPGLIGPALERTANNDPDPYVREAAQNALRMGTLPKNIE